MISDGCKMSWESTDSLNIFYIKSIIFYIKSMIPIYCINVCIVFPNIEVCRIHHKTSIKKCLSSLKRLFTKWWHLVEMSFIDCPSCSMILYLGQVLPVPILSSGTGGACEVWSFDWAAAKGKSMAETCEFIALLQRLTVATHGGCIWNRL